MENLFSVCFSFIVFIQAALPSPRSLRHSGPLRRLICLHVLSDALVTSSDARSY